MTGQARAGWNGDNVPALPWLRRPSAGVAGTTARAPALLRRNLPRGGRMTGRLIVVSNRVAAPQPGGKAPAGGLAVAVKAALRRQSGIWFGWSGAVAPEPSAEPQIISGDRISYALVDLAETDFNEYYNGFANRVLWPILHYRVDLAEFNRADLGGYMRVNRLFADHLSRIIAPDDVIWIHDYHLMPLARELRARGHENRIGFFLHIPFPPPDIVTVLPRHADTAGSLVDYDLVGLQTDNDRDNLIAYLAGQGATAGRDGASVDTGQRVTRIESFPVGIETAKFERLARRVARSGFVRDVIDSLTGRSLVIGVDRLDYSKGITNRLEAFERFLLAHPEWRGRVTLLQIAPKSRAEIPEYAEMDRMVSAAAGRINGSLGEASWTPIRYVNRSYSRTALAGLYRAARVGLVTPLRDGMNLVAKEYVASQDPEDPGVLVLSRFAGAAAELESALLVNPMEPEGVAAAIHRGLEMPLEERRERHAQMLERLEQNDISHWADRFLDALVAPPPRPTLLEGLRSLLSG
jgi:trehalose 6-phosphate synthase